MIRLLLRATLILFSVIFAYWLLHGPFHVLFPVNSPMNPEGGLAVSALLLLLLAPKPEASLALPETDRPLWVAGLAAVAAVFWPSLPFPFLSDDYLHILSVGAPISWSEFIRHQFTVPAYDLFFRPLSMIQLRLDGYWAGHNPFLWHMGNLALHLFNSVLVYKLAREFAFSNSLALTAMLVFGLHGTRPEVVAWIAARFDLLATLFLLTGLLLFLRPGRCARLLSLLLCLAALLSKESAYVFPLLATILYGVRRAATREGLWKLLPYYALTAAVFLYRWQLLGGIGGYQEQGAPTIFTFSLARTVRALALRLWAVLWFPVNYSQPAGPVLTGLLLALLIATIALVFLVRHRGQTPRWALFTLISALPVQHMLLIGPDLEKSRVVYLPAAGFALLLAAALEALPARRVQHLLAAVFILVQAAALSHNLSIWGQVSRFYHDHCAQAAGILRQTSGPVAFTNMPNVLQGVYFLHNGLPQCVAMEFAQDGRRVLPNPPPSGIPPGAPAFVWTAHGFRPAK